MIFLLLVGVFMYWNINKFNDRLSLNQRREKKKIVNYTNTHLDSRMFDSTVDARFRSARANEMTGRYNVTI